VQVCVLSCRKTAGMLVLGPYSLSGRKMQSGWRQVVCSDVAATAPGLPS
jgi:hypothetical protein